MLGHFLRIINVAYLFSLSRSLAGALLVPADRDDEERVVLPLVAGFFFPCEAAYEQTDRKIYLPLCPDSDWTD